MSDEQLSHGVNIERPPAYDDWREMLVEGTLLGTECTSCGQTTAAPKRRCSRCGSERLDSIVLPTSGTMYSETTIEVTPAEFDDSYQIAIVDLDGTLLTARVEGTVAIGDCVRFSDTITNDDYPAPVFEPVE